MTWLETKGLWTSALFAAVDYAILDESKNSVYADLLISPKSPGLNGTICVKI